MLKEDETDKEESKLDEDDDEPMKLSQELSQSMSILTDDEFDEWTEEITESLDNADTPTTNIKTKDADERTCTSPPKIAHAKYMHGTGILDFTSNSGKRSAVECSLTLKARCQTDSPRSYPEGTSSRQPQPIIEEEEGVSFSGFDDFESLDCSQIEKEAIAISQREEAKINHLIEDMDWSDYDDEDFWDSDGISDEEFADAIR